MIPDAALAGLWLAALGGAVAICVGLHRLGVRTTFVRDLLHVGTGVWVLGWPAWRRPWLPAAITLAALVAVPAVPGIARRSHAVERVRRALASGDERWGGVVLYVLAYAGLTVVGLVASPRPAGGALLALSLGDGLGGSIGRHLGRLRYRVPGGKTKTVEGTVAVAGFAAVGIGLASARLGALYGAPVLLSAAAAGAVAEALSPRGTDNLLLPAAVWGWLTAFG